MFRLTKTYSDDEDLFMCPLLVEVEDIKLRNLMKGKKYQLQVWNREGKVCY